MSARSASPESRMVVDALACARHVLGVSGCDPDAPNDFERELDG